MVCLASCFIFIDSGMHSTTLRQPQRSGAAFMRRMFSGSSLNVSISMFGHEVFCMRICTRATFREFSPATISSFCLVLVENFLRAIFREHRCQSEKIVLIVLFNLFAQELNSVETASPSNPVCPYRVFSTGLRCPKFSFRLGRWPLCEYAIGLYDQGLFYRQRA